MKNSVFVSSRLGALSLALAAIPAAAQQALQEVVVSASRTEQRLQDALPATTLITRADIERAQTPDLPSLLKRVTGVQVTQNGGAGTVSAAFIRGAETRHTLVMIDGVPVNNLNFGSAAIEHLSLADVDRIEIVRGNVSSLYGSAALGGVIQIFTRQAGPTPQASLTVQGGSRGLAQANASGSVRLNSGTQLRATAEVLENKGFNSIKQEERPGTNPDRDGYNRRAASLGVAQELSGGNTVGLRLRDSHGKTRYDSQFGPANQADESRFAERGAVIDGRFRLAEGWQLHGALTESIDKLDADVTAFPFFVHSKSRGAQLGLEGKLAPGQQLTAGVEHGRQRLASDTVYNRSQRDLDSVRVGYTGDMGAHQFQLNLRQDRYSDFGSASTWYAGYGFRITPAWRVSATASTGFNAPTFNDLFYPFGGNANLRPEKVKSAELALQYAVEGQELRATLFNNRFTDLIASDSFFNRMNIGHARNRGLELSWRGKIGDYGVQAGLTSQEPIDTDTGARLARRAAGLANLSLTRDLGPWQLGGDLRYSGARPDGTRRLGSYAVLDLTAAYVLSKEVKLFGRIDNATNRDYETVYGYRQGSRGLFAGITWTPKL
ncbi:MAG TPA: TonB-dependent receptor [Ramlibacter sp.]|nr:TonB-dependent receptor [Ramlibacter sp.]